MPGWAPATVVYAAQQLVWHVNVVSYTSGGTPTAAGGPAGSSSSALPHPCNMMYAEMAASIIAAAETEAAATDARLLPSAQQFVSAVAAALAAVDNVEAGLQELWDGTAAAGRLVGLFVDSGQRVLRLWFQGPKVEKVIEPARRVEMETRQRTTNALWLVVASVGGRAAECPPPAADLTNIAHSHHALLAQACYDCGRRGVAFGPHPGARAVGCGASTRQPGAGLACGGAPAPLEAGIRA